MRVPTLKCSGGCIGFTALLFFVGGLTLQFVIDGVVSKQAQDMLPLKGNDSALFQPWVDHGGYGSPIYNYMYVWNITNPEEYLQGEKPDIEKIGPFVYRMFDWRENVTWSDDDAKENISFTYHNYNVFIPERTSPELDLKAKVYVPNFALQGVLTTVRSALMDRPIVMNAAFEAIRVVLARDKEGILMHRTIDEVMWGFYDPTLTALADVAKTFHIELPANLKGFIGLQMIDTPEFYAQPSIQYSGTSDYKLTAEYRTWCGLEDLSQFWPEAPEIKGSDGWQFSPNPDDTITLFIDALPAVVNITKWGKADIQGIHCHTYGLSAETWDNQSWFGQTHYLYGPNGVVNATASQTANIMVSKPHFLDADPYYASLLTGMEPADRDRDDTTIWIEPITGSAVAANQRIMINLQMSPWLCEATEPIQGPFPGDCNIAEAVIPMMIANQIISVPPNEADALKSQIYGIPNTVKLVAWILFGASFALIGWTALIVKAVRTPHPYELVHGEEEDIASANGDYEAPNPRK
eukprot:TRINITY_DN244_c0_g1_i1.p1 TRINITY_DN244_c0_g1~~TRINITY_DN244_c0_g1_i1.p1  ORF type:complete len:522 (+),score=186.29 TRINITY_DN244_c0_g1_i1:72-1637(+)